MLWREMQILQIWAFKSTNSSSPGSWYATRDNSLYEILFMTNHSFSQEVQPQRECQLESHHIYNGSLYLSFTSTTCKVSIDSEQQSCLTIRCARLPGPFSKMTSPAHSLAEKTHSLDHIPCTNQVSLLPSICSIAWFVSFLHLSQAYYKNIVSYSPSTSPPFP